MVPHEPELKTLLMITDHYYYHFIIKFATRLNFFFFFAQNTECRKQCKAQNGWDGERKKWGFWKWKSHGLWNASESKNEEKIYLKNVENWIVMLSFLNQIPIEIMML